MHSCVLSESKKKHRRPQIIKDVSVQPCSINPKTKICEPKSSTDKKEKNK